MKKIIKEILPYIIIIIVVVLIRSFIITPVKVNGTSMVPTLKGDEIMLLNKLDSLNRFDIVVIKSEEDDNLIKRIIALPGETIEIKDDTIYINDEELKEDYGYGKTYDVDKITLKDDEYYVLGDNRLVSKDSRIFGPFKKSNIKGTANFILFPFSKFGKVD